MSDIHTDITNGNDSTGDGSASTPYQTIQKALDNANGGDTVWIGDSGTNTLSSQLNWTAFGGVQDTSADNTLVVRGWDYSSGAGVAGRAVIAGNSLSGILAAAKNYTVWYDLDISGTDGASHYALDAGNSSIVHRCTITSITGTTSYALNLGTGSSVFNTKVATVVGGLRCVGTNHVDACSITAFTYRGILAAANVVLVNNIIASNAGHGIVLNGDNVHISQNTVVGDGATSTIYGIDINSISEGSQILGNLIKGWSATSNVGINNVASNNIGICGYNHFDDNTADMANVTDNLDVDLTSSDSTSAVTFTNAGGGDYSIDTGDTGYDAPFYGISTSQYMDTGAAQRANTGGGLLVNPGMSGGMRG